MTHRLLTILALLLSLSACGDSDGPADSFPDASAVEPGTHTGSAMIDADEGGIIESDDGRLTLDIPAGALEDDTEISIDTVKPGDLPKALEGAGLPMYSLGPDGTRFLKPVGVTLELPDGALPDDRVAAYPLITHSGGKTLLLGRMKLHLTTPGGPMMATGVLTHFSIVGLYDDADNALFEASHPDNTASFVDEDFVRSISLTSRSNAQQANELGDVFLEATSDGGSDPYMESAPLTKYLRATTQQHDRIGSLTWRGTCDDVGEGTWGITVKAYVGDVTYDTDDDDRDLPDRPANYDAADDDDLEAPPDYDAADDDDLETDYDAADDDDLEVTARDLAIEYDLADDDDLDEEREEIPEADIYDQLDDDDTETPYKGFRVAAEVTFGGVHDCLGRAPCCLPDGSCDELKVADCASMGGTNPDLLEDSCADVDCDAPKACCREDGTCDELRPANCMTIGGEPTSVDSCSDAKCEAPSDNPAMGFWHFYSIPDTIADPDSASFDEDAEAWCPDMIVNSAFMKHFYYEDGAVALGGGDGVAVRIGDWTHSASSNAVQVTGCGPTWGDIGGPNELDATYYPETDTIAGKWTDRRQVNDGSGGFINQATTQGVCGVHVVSTPPKGCVTSVCTIWRTGAMPYIPGAPDWIEPYRKALPVTCTSDVTDDFGCCNGDTCSVATPKACDTSGGDVVNAVECTPNICTPEAGCYQSNGDCDDDTAAAACLDGGGVPADGTCGKCEVMTTCENLVEADCTGTWTTGESCP